MAQSPSATWAWERAEARPPFTARLRRRALFPALLLALLVGALPTSVVSAAGFTNGSFELPGVPMASSPLVLSAGGTNLVGWTIGGTGGPLSVYYSYLGSGAADGSNDLAFNALNRSPGTWIAQSFDTSIGAKYDVTYFVGRGSSGGGVVSLTALVRSQTASLLAQTNSSPSTIGYGAIQHLEFTATTATSTLEFLDTSTATTGVDVLLDNVVLTKQECVSIPQGCVAWWPGEGNANDFLGTNTGNLINGVTFLPGKLGQAFSFDGVDDVLVVPSNLALEPQEITLHAWINATESTAPILPIIAKQGAGNGQASYTLYLDSQMRPTVSFFNGLTDIKLASQEAIETGRWYHIAGTRRGTEMRLYVDGLQVTNTAFAGSIAYDSARAIEIGLYLRSEPSAGFRFSGQIDEIRLYNRALSAIEIQSLVGPLITSHPTNTFATPGGTASFSVGVADLNFCPPYYQWLFNAMPIPGGTNAVLDFTNVQATNAGAYSVIISNAIRGTATSSNATLTIV